MQMKSPLHARSCSVFDDKAFTALFVLILFLSSFFIFSGSALATSTSMITHTIPLTGYCNNPDPHCYATRDWFGSTPGSYTLINPYGALNCHGCSGFIDDETWFSDTQSFSCIHNPLGSCWVEGGISTYSANEPDSCNLGHDSTCGFWADNRIGGGYHEHPLYNFGADGVDLTPYLFYISIFNNDGFSSSGSIWELTIDIYKNGNYIAGPYGQSKNNSMNVNDITIGSELSDSGGSAAPFYFQYNEWMDGSGIFHYQTNTGVNNSINPPPSGYWWINPCNCQGNTGGSFKTYD
ncbi:MAG: hypothetical protein ACYDER_16215 [Ktedonobacteraceae bacterium]